MVTSRRDFLVLGSLAGASLVISCRERAARDERAGVASSARLNFWLAVGPDGGVELRTTKLEMGQGIWTTLAMLAAEELALEPSAVRLTVPSTEEVRRAPARERIERQDKLLDTSSSVSLERSWLPVRTAAAAAREMLVGAASARWGVPADECGVENGRVVHAASGRSAGFGELAPEAALRPVPAAPKLKRPAEFRVLGRPTRRHEGPEIVAGRTRFSADFRLPGQRFAVLARPPALGARAGAVDDSAARATPGVLDVLGVGERGVAVVGETTWAALAGRERLKISWDGGTAPELSSASFARELERALDAPELAVDAPSSDTAEAADAEGETAKASRARNNPERGIGFAVAVSRRGRTPEPSGTGVHRAEYATGFQAHAPMEPPNAVALWHADGPRCEVWCGTQFPHYAAARLARRYRLGPGGAVVHPLRMGGSFGRKEADDFVVEAVEIARARPGVPVQVFWSRDDDLAQDYFHAATRHRCSARLDGGRIVAWRHRVAAPSPERQWGIIHKVEYIRLAETTQAWNAPYRADDFLIEYVEVPCAIQLGFWRGVEAVPNVFAVECFVDELAAAARRDPIEFRLENFVRELSHPRLREPFPLSRLEACYRLVAERSGWGGSLPRGRGRGVAGMVYNGRSACATVAEVTVEHGIYRVDRVICALDCGFVVNPTGFAGQVEGAVVWALSGMDAEITFERGRAVQSNYVDYEIPRLPRMPAVEVAVVPSDQPPAGVGETPVPTIAPAVANALFQATGRRVRRLPIRAEDLA